MKTKTGIDDLPIVELPHGQEVSISDKYPKGSAQIPGI